MKSKNFVLILQHLKKHGKGQRGKKQNSGGKAKYKCFVEYFAAALWYAVLFRKQTAYGGGPGRNRNAHGGNSLAAVIFNTAKLKYDNYLRNRSKYKCDKNTLQSS